MIHNAVIVAEKNGLLQDKLENKAMESGSGDFAL